MDESLRAEIWPSCFRCPLCHGAMRIDKGLAKKRLECEGCGAEFFYNESGIPMVTNGAALEELLSERRSHKEDWFRNDQIEACYRGPYRHIFRHRVDYWTSRLKPMLNTDSVVLDYGCGDGSNLCILAELPHKVLLGVDYNLTRLERAKQLVSSRDEVICGDILEGSIAPNSFDIIFCNHVLEHIQQDQRVLLAFYEALKPWGSFDGRSAK